MPDAGLNFPQVYLKPGELYIAQEPTIILTILGSCIGATFWNRRLGVGALCHAMLPRVSRRVRPRAQTGEREAIRGLLYIGTGPAL